MTKPSESVSGGAADAELRTRLTAAGADLPAKLRVHELAKRAGLTSKDVVAQLATLGTTVASSSSSVTADVAQALLTSLMPVEPQAAAEPVPEEPAARPRRRRAARPAAPAGAEVPVEAAPVENSPAEAVEAPAAAAPRKTPGRGSRAAAAAPVETPAETAVAQAPAAADEAPAESPAPRSRRRRASRPAAPAGAEVPVETVAVTPEPAPAPDTSAPDTSAPDTSALDAALVDLPSRSRVHELAKRAGITAKEMLAALAEQGLTVKSASSVVGADDARSVLTALLVPVAQTPVAEETAPAADPINPLFIAPDPAAAESGRRGRRGRGRGRSGETAESAEATENQAPAADVELPADAEEIAAVTDEAGETAEEGRRRRRRGRRGGRGRGGADNAADIETTDEAAAEVAEDAAAESVEDDTEDGAQSGSSSSRRRRRRRRGSSEEGRSDEARTDDPADTVVHVRETRSAESLVQGVRGSTRLEAKRQRRRESRDTRRRPQILTEAEFLARREAVHRVMAVRQRGDLAQVALLEDGVLVEHFVSRGGSASMIGNVYVGRVQNVLPSMEAAFIDIGRGRNAVLYAGEVNWDAAGLAGKSRKIETALSSGDSILVQISKDPVGHKGARLTTQISLPGRFLVYVPGGGATGISRKLPDTERKRLKQILDRIVPEDAGVIIRTAAEGVSEEELARDVERLKAQWEDILARSGGMLGRTGKQPEQLYAEPDTLIKVVRDLFNSDISEMIIDGDQAWDSLSSYVTQVAPELSERITRFSGRTDVFAAHRIDEQIAKALERKVHLPSGGSLVIDRTEAMTVIDVNTGKYTGSGGNLEETVTKNNLEAAEEIVRQLRLRDIGGIIVVDFIDMVLESNRDLVVRRLTECLGRDRTRHQVAEVTSLGLVQMTRKKMGTGLVEAFSEQCSHCHGRGIVIHDTPMDLHPEQSDKHADKHTDKSKDSGDGEGRGGKRNRNRDRDRDRDRERTAEPAADFVIPVVAPRPPDPRGPKGPGKSQAAADSSTAVDAAPVETAAAEVPVVEATSGKAPKGAKGKAKGSKPSVTLAELPPLPEPVAAPEDTPAPVLDVDAIVDQVLAGMKPSAAPVETPAESPAEDKPKRRRGGRGRSRGGDAPVDPAALPVIPAEWVADSDEPGASTAETPEPAEEKAAETAAEPVTEPVADTAPAAAPRARRRAGRPAGAPASAEAPVAMVSEPVAAEPAPAEEVPAKPARKPTKAALARAAKAEAERVAAEAAAAATTAEATPAAPAEEAPKKTTRRRRSSAAAGAESTGTASAPAPVEGAATPSPSVADVPQEPAVAPAAPRRRRAASRPAGPPQV